jgi:hypothetical protein
MVEKEIKDTNFFCSTLGYEQLLDCSQIAISYPEYQELEKIGADKVYFSGDFPAILFKEVESFNEQKLREIAEIQRKVWNYRKVIFLFVVSDTEIRIYNCYEKPKYLKPDVDVNAELESYEIFKTQKDDKANLEILVELFSQVGVDCGLLWTSDYGIREKVNVQRRIDRYLVQSLLKTAKELSKDISDKETVHGLLMRSLFILYLEDKGAAKEAGLYRQIKQDANSYFDILEDVDATYKLFDALHEHFNGNVFPITEGEQECVTAEHLQIIKNCFIDGDVSGNPKLFENWRVFDFSFIQIELLSEVYENFLGELDEKKAKGQFYTPYFLVELILNDKLPTKGKTNYQIKTLDIACGSGIFLVEAYKRLIQRWKNANPGKKIFFTDLRDILVDNIFGIEIDPLAIKVAAFSLYLALVEELDPKTLWIEKEYRLPYLINNPDDKTLENKQGNNLLCGDTIGKIDAEKFIIKADLLVGNPPFGTKKISKSIMDYCKKHNFGKEMVLPFLHKAVDFCPEGNIALIFNAKVLTNTEKPYQNFRKWLLNDTYVEKIYNFSIFRKMPKNFGGQLFTSAVGPVCIVYYQKKQPEKPANTIEYRAPKTYIKNNLIDGLIVDSTDIKLLPRYECQKPDTKIWKIAMWGNIADSYLLQLLSTYPNFKTFLEQKNIKKGLGLQFLDNSTKKPKKDLSIPQKYVAPEDINRYFTCNFSTLQSGLSEKSKKIYSTLYEASVTGLHNIEDFRRLGAKETYTAPHILIKEGLNDWQICASYVNETCSFNSKVLGIHCNDEKILKGLTCYLNSSIAKYYLFMISASIGIEREELKPNEYYQLPFPLDDMEIYQLSDMFDNFIQSDYINRIQNAKQFEKDIDDFLFNTFQISEKDKILISDAFECSFTLLIDGIKSKALNRVTLDENKVYAQMLRQELTDFFSEENYKINVNIYNVRHYDPLNLVVLHFGDVEKPVEVKSAVELAPLLKELNNRSVMEKGRNIYVQKQFRYYDNDTIYLIKPNQKRFWTRSQAIDDAMSLIIEIASTGGKE